MKTYKTEIIGGHILIDCEGQRFLVDTGSPATFSASGSISICGETISVPTSLMGVSSSYITEKVGAPVQGLIGMDLIGRFGMCVDVENCTVTFGECGEGMTKVPSYSIPGSIVMQMEINGKVAKVIPDTGAPTSYISPSFTEGLESVDTVTDFSPFSGTDTFETPVFDVAAEVAGRPFSMKVGHLPSELSFMLRMLGVDGCVGMDFLKHFKVLFSGDGVFVS